MARYVVKVNKGETYVFSTVPDFGAVNYTFDPKLALHFLTLEQAENFLKGYGLFFTHSITPVYP